MAQIFGHFSDELPDSQEYLTIAFSPSSVPLKQRWKTNGLSADFMADYFATFFPGTDGVTSEINTQAEFKNVVSFIANELLENAMKFNDENSQDPISIRLHMNSQRLLFLATNSVSLQGVEHFQTYIKELTTSDPNDLYLRQLENSAVNESESRLGLLTMMNDYLAKLGWKFETSRKNPDVMIVTTMVELAV